MGLRQRDIGEEGEGVRMDASFLHLYYGLEKRLHTQREKIVEMEQDINTCIFHTSQRILCFSSFKNCVKSPPRVIERLRKIATSRFFFSMVAIYSSKKLYLRTKGILYISTKCQKVKTLPPTLHPPLTYWTQQLVVRSSV